MLRSEAMRLPPRLPRLHRLERSTIYCMSLYACQCQSVCAPSLHTRLPLAPVCVSKNDAPIRRFGRGLRQVTFSNTHNFTHFIHFLFAVDPKTRWQTRKDNGFWPTIVASCSKLRSSKLGKLNVKDRRSALSGH